MREIHRLGVTAFTAGASVMVVEILGSRLFAPYFGSSTYVWSALIGVILAFLSIGYYLGGKLADRNPSKNYLAGVLFLAGALVFIIPILAPYIAAISLLTGYRLGPLVFALVLFSGPSILLGMAPPYTIKLAAENLVEIGSVVGDLYALSTVGSIVGTLLSGFVLIPLLPISGIFAGVTVVLFLTALLLGRPSWQAVGVSIAVIVVFSFFLTANADGMYHPNETVLYHKYTPYQRVLVLEDSEGKTRRMQLDSSYSGKMNIETNLTGYEYIKFFELPFLYRRNISTVYMIGEGAGVGVIQIRMNHPETKVIVTEIDPEVHYAAREYFNFREGNGVEVEIGDSRQTLKQSSELYDLVILDAFNSISFIPIHLTTKEFFHEIKTHMKPDGILEANVISILDEHESIFLSSICKTMNEEFKHIRLYPVTSTNKTRIQNIMILASDRPLEPTIEFRQTNLFNETELQHMLNQEIDDYNCSNGILLTDDYSPVDYLMEPVMEKTFEY